jgi:hypothetical protein
MWILPGFWLGVLAQEMPRFVSHVIYYHKSGARKYIGWSHMIIDLPYDNLKYLGYAE